MFISFYDSPIGKILIEENNGKLTYLGNTWDDINNKEVKETDLIKEVKKQLNEYFLGQRTEFDIPIELNGTDYLVKVWNELLKIPYGKTVNYGKIAENIGNKKGSRSVGMACGKNKIMIVVPCHRVIGSSGKLTGFAGGLDVKEKLLNLEKNK